MAAAPSDLIGLELRALAVRGDHSGLARLGRSVLHELEARSRLPSTLVVLPPDPAASVAVGGRTLLLSEMQLPERETAGAARLAHLAHCYCCEASAACGDWHEVERHAESALACLRALPASSASPEQRCFSELCLTHAALAASSSHSAAAATGGTHQWLALRRRLREHCERREVAATAAAAAPQGSRGAEAAALLELATAASATLRADDALPTLVAALRCVARELGLDAEGARDAETLGLVRPAGQRAAPGAVGEAGSLLEMLARHAPLVGLGPGGDGQERNTQGGRLSKRPRDEAAPEGGAQGAEPGTPAEGRRALSAALARCAELAVRLALPAECEARCTSAVWLAERCLGRGQPSAALEPCEPLPLGSAAEAPAAGASCLIAGPLGVAASALAAPAALHTQAVIFFREAAALAAADGPPELDSLLRRAEDCSARAAAVTAAAAAAWGGAAACAAEAAEAAEAAARCARSHAVLLLLTGRAQRASECLRPAAAAGAAAAGARFESPSPLGTMVSLEELTTAAVLHACCARPQACLDCLQRALSVGSSDGIAPPLALYNLLVHYDRLGQRAAAARMAAFLAGCELGGEPARERGEGGEPELLLAVRASERAPPLSLHAVRAALCPVGARYLQGRTALLDGRGPAAAAAAATTLRALLPEQGGRGLVRALAALDAEPGRLVREVGCAMLRAGEAAELLALLRARGEEGLAGLEELVAEARLCEHEPGAALAVLDALQERLGLAPPAADAPRPAVHSRLSGGSTNSEALQQAAAAGGTNAAVGTELRLRNNRACLLTCEGRFAEAERELIAARMLAPAAVPPAYNLFLLWWQLAERRRASEMWMRFRGWPLEATPDVYEQRAAAVLPSRTGGGPPPPETHVSGEVDPASVAAVDRTVLRFWAELLSAEAVARHWGAAVSS